MLSIILAFSFSGSLPENAEKIADRRSPITDHRSRLFCRTLWCRGTPFFSRPAERHESVATRATRVAQGVGPPHAPPCAALPDLGRAGRPAQAGQPRRNGQDRATPPWWGRSTLPRRPPTAPWRRRSASSRPRNPSLRCGFWTARGGAVKVAWQSSRTKIEQRRMR